MHRPKTRAFDSSPYPTRLCHGAGRRTNLESAESRGARTDRASASLFSQAWPHGPAAIVPVTLPDALILWIAQAFSGVHNSFLCSLFRHSQHVRTGPCLTTMRYDRHSGFQDDGLRSHFSKWLGFGPNSMDPVSMSKPFLFCIL